MATTNDIPVLTIPNGPTFSEYIVTRKEYLWLITNIRDRGKKTKYALIVYEDDVKIPRLYFFATKAERDRYTRFVEKNRPTLSFQQITLKRPLIIATHRNKTSFVVKS